MGTIGNQQHLAAAAVNFNHLPHQAIGIEHGLTHVDIVIFAAVNHNSVAGRVGCNPDQLGYHDTVLQHLGSVQQVAQPHIFCGDFRHPLHAGLVDQQLGAQLFIVFFQLSPRHHRFLPVLTQAGRDVRHPVKGHGDFRQPPLCGLEPGGKTVDKQENQPKGYQ